MTDEPKEKRVPCEVWDRVVGYLRPVDSFNKGKQQERSERVPYNVKREDYTQTREDA